MCCCNCGCNNNAETFKIEKRGYGSHFDGDYFELAFCEDCLTKLKIDKKWFDNENCYYYDNSVGTIVCLYEEHLLELLSKLPQATKEQVENCYNIHNDFPKAYNGEA